jgi:site-specific recombinase XerD
VDTVSSNGSDRRSSVVERPRGGAPRKTLGLTPYHEALFSSFIEEETARGRRHRGVIGLRNRSPRFIRFMEDRGRRVSETTTQDAYAYQGSLLDTTTEDGAGYESNTILSYINAAHAFCAYLARTGVLLDNPFSHIHRVRRPKKLPSGILRESEMATLLATLHTWDIEGNLKDASRRYLLHVAAELQYASGLRSAEVAALTSADVDTERALVYVRDGKQGSQRIAFLTDYAAQVLELYLAMMRSLLANQQKAQADRLFFKDYDRFGHLMNEELERACVRSGLPKITSHGFRHALGYHLLRGGCPLRYIQAILGHKNIANTEVYTKVDIADVKSVFDACHPRMHG